VAEAGFTRGIVDALRAHIAASGDGPWPVPFECRGCCRLPSGGFVVVLDHHQHGLVLWEVEPEATAEWVGSTVSDILEQLDGGMTFEHDARPDDVATTWVTT